MHVEISDERDFTIDDMIIPELQVNFCGFNIKKKIQDVVIKHQRALLVNGCGFTTCNGICGDTLRNPSKYPS